MRNRTAVAIGVASAAVWTYLLGFRGGFWKARTPPRPRVPPPRTKVVAVIPARDEAGHVGAAVKSLRDQLSRVIVVDDNSSDDTAAEANRNGATVIRGRALPPGWTGKMWAVAQGVDTAVAETPEWLLLTDADIIHGQRAVPELLARAEEGGYDLVSLMVLLRADSWAERALMPAFVFFFLMLYPPKWIENPRRRTAGAAGGCMLIRREMLERAGGIAAIRAELIDDCALARAVKRSGGRVWLGLTRESRSTRAYVGFGEIGRMISRTAFTQLNYSPWLLCGTLAGLAITYVAPPALVLMGRPLPAALGAASWLAMSIAYAPMLRFYRKSILWAPVLPLVALFYAGATADSAIRYWTGAGGSWKGRAQAIGQQIRSRPDRA